MFIFHLTFWSRKLHLSPSLIYHEAEWDSSGSKINHKDGCGFSQFHLQRDPPKGYSSSLQRSTGKVLVITLQLTFGSEEIWRRLHLGKGRYDLPAGQLSSSFVQHRTLYLHHLNWKRRKRSIPNAIYAHQSYQLHSTF